MDDLFYFTKSRINLQDMANLCEELGYKHHYVARPYDSWLNVYYRDENFWQWSELKEEDGDFNSFEPSQRERISELQPLSAFVIQHHIVSWPQLLPFLKNLLGHYGGWIECDDESSKAYTLENIEHLQYPFLRDGPPI